jgi:hypothetical protein
MGPSYIRMAIACIGVFPGIPTVAGTSEPSQSHQEIVGAVLIHDECARVFPKLAERTAGDYGAWRARNRGALRDIEANTKYKMQVQEDEARIRKAQDAGRPGAAAPDRQLCESFFAATFAGSATATASTPKEAWSGFLAQLRAGDAQKALTFLTGGARARFGELFDTLEAQGLRKASEGFAELDSYDVGGDLAFGHFVRVHPDGERQAFEITFLRDKRSGYWFIDSM